MPRRFRTVLVFSSIVALSVSIPACSRVERLPTAPRSGAGVPRASAPTRVAPPGPSFYPLAIGNRWVYAGSSVRRRIVDGVDTLIVRDSWTRRDSVAGDTTLAGHVYARIDEVGRDGVVRPSFRRQDSHGLYEWASNEPPAETLVMPYPLHAGSSWKPSALMTVRVEAREIVATPDGPAPAWRIGVAIDEGPGTIRLWFGACGLIGTLVTSHREYDDSDGYHVVVDVEEKEWLSSLQVSKR